MWYNIVGCLLMNKIEIINMVKEFNLKEYRVDFKNIVKEVTRLLDIENNLSMSLTICLSDYIHKLNKGELTVSEAPRINYIIALMASICCWMDARASVYF